jgi:hypothetical protein
MKTASGGHNLVVGARETTGRTNLNCNNENWHKLQVTSTVALFYVDVALD